MKTITLSSAAVLLMILGAASKTNAQSDAVYASNTGHIKNGGIDYSSSNDRAISNFKKEFSTVDNAKWIQITDGFISRFEQNDIKYRVGYNQKGDWQNTVRTYTESGLPADVKDIIENVYYGYSISLAEEITTRQKTIYIIHIENNKWMKQIKVDGNETNELEEYEIKK
jgi:hypothetical protein